MACVISSLQSTEHHDTFMYKLYDETNTEVVSIFTADKEQFLSVFDSLSTATTYRGQPYVPRDEFILAYLNREVSEFTTYLIEQRRNYTLDKSTVWTLKCNYKIATRPEDPSLPQYVKDKNRKIRYTYEYLISKGLITN